MKEIKDMKIDFKKMVKIFKALSDENRLKILAIIYEATNHCDCDLGEYSEDTCMKYLSEQLGITMPTVSHHIKELVNAELIITEKKGKYIHCKIYGKSFDIVQEYIKYLNT